VAHDNMFEAENWYYAVFMLLLTSKQQSSAKLCTL